MWFYGLFCGGVQIMMASSSLRIHKIMKNATTLYGVIPAEIKN